MHGYLYAPDDPLTGQRWPSMPTIFRQLAAEAALACGYPDFAPDACLINRYQRGKAVSASG